MKLCWVKSSIYSPGTDSFKEVKRRINCSLTLLCSFFCFSINLSRHFWCCHTCISLLRMTIETSENIGLGAKQKRDPFARHSSWEACDLKHRSPVLSSLKVAAWVLFVILMISSLVQGPLYLYFNFKPYAFTLCSGILPNRDVSTAHTHRAVPSGD